MANSFTLKRGDTSPSIIFSLAPTSVVLTGATARFSMRSRFTGAIKVNRAVAVVVTATGTPTVRYDWQSADSDTSGSYEAEFEITYAGGAVETFPNSGFIPVEISGDIA